MTLKTCLRCDWEGETKSPACPNCGVPLYEIGASPLGGAGIPVEDSPEEQSGEAANATVITPSGTRSRQSNSSLSSPDAVDSSSRSAPSSVAFVLAALALTVALGIWLKARESPARDGTRSQTAGQPGVAFPKVTVMTDRNFTDLTPDVPAPDVPYLIDLTTREMTPLPEAIIRSLATVKWDFSRFAASPDGSSLAFIGERKDGSPQVFTADIDGTGVNQVTNDPNGATSLAWSPDGSKIAYDGLAGGEGPHIFVLDLATEESRQITFHDPPCPRCSAWPQFTPDGSSIIYSGGTTSAQVIRTIPVAGGRSSILFGPGEDVSAGLEGLTYWAAASVSPDGSLVTFVGGGYLPETLPEGSPKLCDRCRFVANADGTDKRIIAGWTQTPHGAWSPDSTRIVAAGDPEPPSPIVVVDVVTGEASKVAEGPATAAIWLDDHTLLVDV